MAEDVVFHKLKEYDRSTSTKRIYTWLFATIQMFFLVWVKYRNAHIVAFTNPPFTVFIPWVLKVKSYDLVIYDAYPDALVNLGYTSHASFFILYGVFLIRELLKVQIGFSH